MDHFTSRRFNPLPTGDVLMKTARDYTPLEQIPEDKFEAMLQMATPAIKQASACTRRCNQGRQCTCRDPANMGTTLGFETADKSMREASILSKRNADELRAWLWVLVPFVIVVAAVWSRYW